MLKKQRRLILHIVILKQSLDQLSIKRNVALFKKNASDGFRWPAAVIDVVTVLVIEVSNSVWRGNQCPISLSLLFKAKYCNTPKTSVRPSYILPQSLHTIFSNQFLFMWLLDSEARLLHFRFDCCLRKLSNIMWFVFLVVDGPRMFAFWTFIEYCLPFIDGP